MYTHRFCYICEITFLRWLYWDLVWDIWWDTLVNDHDGGLSLRDVCEGVCPGMKHSVYFDTAEQAQGCSLFDVNYGKQK